MIQTFQILNYNFWINKCINNMSKIIQLNTQNGIEQFCYNIL